MKNVNFVPKDVKRILSSHKISEKYKEQEVFYRKKKVLKNFRIFTGKHLCWSLLLMKIQAFKPVTLLKETPTQVFS